MSCLRYNVVIDDFIFISRNYIHNFAFSQLDNNIMSTTNMLLELFYIRAGLLKFSSDRLSAPDAQLMIDWIATFEVTCLYSTIFQAHLQLSIFTRQWNWQRKAASLK
jgi:hypothetical protein